jgi:protein gp37
MGDRTKISWTDATWSCFRGCSRTIAAGATTSGCGDPTGGGCYAERNGYRFAASGLPYDGLVRMTPNGARWTGKVMLVDRHLLDPIRWERPRRIFTTSVSDPFHERYSNETIALVFGVMAVTQRHIHQLLTKRVKRMREWYEWLARAAAGENGGRGMSPAAYCFALLQRYVRDQTKFSEADSKLLSRSDIVDAAFAAPWPLTNVWPMASVEHQFAAEERINELLRVPGVVHGLSCEPLIGHVDLSKWLGEFHGDQDQESGGIRLRGGDGGRAGDRERWDNLAGGGSSWRPMGRAAEIDSLCSNDRRPDGNEGVSNSASHGRWQTDDCAVASSHLVSSLRSNPGRHDREPQERDQARQPTGQLRSRDGLRAAPPCDARTAARSRGKSERNEEPRGEIDIDSGRGDSSSTRSRMDADGNRRYVQHHIPTCLGDRARQDSLGWIICGAESGPGARPADPAWFRSLRDQCRAAGVAFFLKQIVVDGKLRKDVSEFPADLRIQEFPR